MASMLESMRTSWVFPGAGANKGLLGPLPSGRDSGGQGAFHGLPGDYGVPHRQFGGPRASLMEVFNRVPSSSEEALHSLFPGR